MKDLEFTLYGVVTKHTTEVKNGITFKKMNVKCSNTEEINDMMDEIRKWGTITDPVSNLAVIRNVDEDPYGTRVVPLMEYGICMNMEICDEVTPVQFKNFKVCVKSKKMKDVDGSKIVKKYLEANLTLEKQQLDSDNRFDNLYLKHSEVDPETGKDVLIPLEIKFSACEPFSIFGETPSDDEDDGNTVVAPVDAG